MATTSTVYISHTNDSLSPVSRPKKKSKCKLLQEQDLLKAAKDGFIEALTELDLIDNAQNSSNQKPHSHGEVRLLNLQQRRLQDISIIDLCERLEICNLSNNFIYDIDPLKWCRSLFCLDAHSNQISHLPGKQFWSSLCNLTVVYLHDNGISRVEELKYLSHCTSLCYLTLYDSPISLKRNYRHCAVNAVFTLKALDNYVVSDEEIIEDANFTDRYKPMKRQLLYVPKYCALKQRQLLTYENTIKIINADLAKINAIQSKHCPVIILQKYIRGFLIRLKYSYIKDTRLWAAVSIQRFYRNWKGYPDPPPTTPNSIYQAYLYKSLSSMRLDYDTYVKVRRSKHISLKSEKTSPYSLPYLSEGENIGRDLRVRKKHYTSQISSSMPKISEQSLDQALSMLNIKQGLPNKDHHECNEIHTLNDFKEYHNNNNMNPWNKHMKEIETKNQQKTLPRIGKFYAQHAFLGELDTLKKKLKQQNLQKEEDEVEFRLMIHKPYVMLHDPLEELILRTVEGADDIRKSVKEIDRMYAKGVPPKSPKRPRKELDRMKELFLKNQASMNFSTFKAVDKAYQDRNKAEEHLKKTRKVRTIKAQEKTGKVKVLRHKRNYKDEACFQKHTERIQILEDLEARRTQEALIRDKTSEMKIALHDSQKRAKNNYNVALKFRSQVASVGKALAANDFGKRKREIRIKNRKVVTELRDELEDKKARVENYQEQQIFIRQNDTVRAKQDLEIQLFKNTAKRAVELREMLKLHQEKSLRQFRLPTVLRVRELYPRDMLVTSKVLTSPNPYTLPELYYESSSLDPHR